MQSTQPQMLSNQFQNFIIKPDQPTILPHPDQNIKPASDPNSESKESALGDSSSNFQSKLSDSNSEDFKKQEESQTPKIHDQNPQATDTKSDTQNKITNHSKSQNLTISDKTKENEINIYINQQNEYKQQQIPYGTPFFAAPAVPYYMVYPNGYMVQNGGEGENWWGWEKVFFSKKIDESYDHRFFEKKKQKFH